MRYNEQQTKLETLVQENRTLTDKINEQEDELKKVKRQIKSNQDFEKIIKDYRERFTNLEEGLEWQKTQVRSKDEECIQMK